ncbi:MAG: mannose-6-phosphate isomerase, class I [Spirochaetaceae bacterium]|jgi:mannose-6-phosphate isomerase|nr:mannose-6-phosphate isomerase, class I [Spirochaetaceae bacterium]
MNGAYKLRNKIKRYDWGSAEYIPELLGIENSERESYAEMWMGTHPNGPSFAVLDDGEAPLSRVSGELPFLFKLLAAEKPLSIQAHPDKAQAEAGYAEENARNIPLDAPRRVYKDPNHKPEIICALTPFRALCGFRKTDGIRKRLSLFSCPSAKKLLRPLDSGANLNAGAAENGALKEFLSLLFELSTDERAELSEYINENIQNMKDERPEYAAELELTGHLAALFPRDPSALSPLYLNLIELAPGEAIFVPAGILHSYIHGAGAELMAASDNVIRGGLTSKLIDRAGLFGILKFVPFLPPVYRPQNAAFCEYAAPAGGFSLYRLKNSGGETGFPVFGASILVCLNGTVRFGFKNGETLTLRRGESAFIADGARRSLRLSGNFEACAAGGLQRASH